MKDLLSGGSLSDREGSVGEVETGRSDGGGGARLHHFRLVTERIQGSGDLRVLFRQRIRHVVLQKRKKDVSRSSSWRDEVTN